jgi:hypothetical protein
MQINYTLNTNELDINFLEAIKLLFKDKDITISINDAEDEKEDNALANAITEGLLSSSVSKDELNKVLYAD